MTQQQVIVNGSTWQFAPESAWPYAINPQALLVADVVDEITGAPPAVALSAATTSIGVVAKATSSGRTGLVGQPLTLFAPNYVTGATLGMTVAADGFLPLSLSGSLPAQPGPPPYPDSFVPIDLDTVAMHRATTTISGRTVKPDRTPLSGSIVSISQVWTTLADIQNNTPAAANLIAIAPGLYLDSAVGFSVSQLNVSPALAQGKQLIGAFAQGAQQIRLSDMFGLAVGNLLIIDWPDKGRAEIIAIAGIINQGSGPDLPATAVLAQSLARDHREGVAVYPAMVAPAGAPNGLNRTALTGDLTLYPGAMSGLDASMVSIEISGGALPEYHWAQIYQTTSDADGYFQLPPIHRVAQVQIHATNVSEPNPVDLPITLDLGLDAVVVDLVFA